jgi:hypothetical protein
MEGLETARNAEILNLIDELIATVVPFAWETLGVLVAQT